MRNKTLEWVLRIAIFGEFFGHGVFALGHKEGWLKYFEAVGVTNHDTAFQFMTWIGVMDIALAFAVLVVPMSLPLLWMAFWGLLTAMIRWPLGPDPVWDFFERWANWGAPLALFFYYGIPGSVKEWIKVRK